uniref:Uncharacterized protein n=1 Tax=Opuntia streptacantha TaxID=393608 RepID=A0A7C8ZIN0_OPUST
MSIFMNLAKSQLLHQLRLQLQLQIQASFTDRCMGGRPGRKMSHQKDELPYTPQKSNWNITVPTEQDVKQHGKWSSMNHSKLQACLMCSIFQIHLCFGYSPNLK